MFFPVIFFKFLTNAVDNTGNMSTWKIRYNCLVQKAIYDQHVDQINPLEFKGNYSAASNEVGTLAVDGWAVTFGTARRGLGGTGVPITVLLYIGPLPCSFNVPIKRKVFPCLI